jgi:hypothetical protein
VSLLASDARADALIEPRKLIDHRSMLSSARSFRTLQRVKATA